MTQAPDVAALTLPLPTIPTIDAGTQAAIFASLEASQNTPKRTVLIPKTGRVRKRAAGKRLVMMDPEHMHAEGDCPGGRYHFVQDVDRAIQLLTYWAEKKAWAAVDLETGLCWRERYDEEIKATRRYYDEVIDPYTCIIFLASVSVEPGVAVVFDMRNLMKVDAFNDAFRRFLTDCKLVAHNCQFEQVFFLAQFQTCANFVFDTMLVNQLITAGLEDSSRLDVLLEKYFDLKLDKQWQEFFIKIDHRSPIPNEAVAYSAGDVCQLLALAQKLQAELVKSGLEHVWLKFEQPFMKWIAKAKAHGIAIDRAFFEEMLGELSEKTDATRAEFQAKCPGVHIGSNQQLKNWFADQGMHLKSVDKKNLEKLLMVPVIGPVADIVLQYRAIAKLRSTYVVPIINGKLPSPVTGRVHPNWGQLFTVTGRMNCKEPNFQNIPARTELGARIRKGFVAEPGHTLVYVDYSQFEVRALAEMANEPRMISVFEEAYHAAKELEEYCSQHGLPLVTTDWPEKKAEQYQAICQDHPKVAELVVELANCDFHRRTAAMLFKVPVEEVTKQQRTNAKTITFALPYGAGPPKISAEAKIEIREAEKLLEQYKESFPSVARFLELCRTQGRRGCTQSPVGRKRFYALPNKMAMKQRLMQLQALGDATWQKLVATWYTRDLHEMAEKIVRAKVGSVERQATNHPIQAANADATKLATVMAGPRLEALHPECLIIGWVHDEIILTAPDAVAEKAAAILSECMIAAAKTFLKKLPVEVSVSMGKCWGK